MSHTTLTSNELLPLVCQFQDGIYEELLPLMGHIFGNNYDLFPFSQVMYVGCRTVPIEGNIESDMVSFSNIFSPFYTKNGVRGVSRMLECFPYMRSILLSYAARNGLLQLIEFLHTGDDLFYNRPTLMVLASQHGHLDVLRFLIRHDYPLCTIDIPASMGHLNIVQSLHHANAYCTTRAMDEASRHGHFEVVKFLHKNRNEGCTCIAMDAAAANGHFNIVEYLHTYRTEGCTTNAVDQAALRGHREIVQFLLSNRIEGGSPNLVDEVSGEGNFSLVRMLHERNMRCSVEAMNNAAARGHLEIVKFLHTHRTEGCTTIAMDTASEKGFLDVVKFLHENRAEGCTTYAMDRSAKNGFLEIVQYLHENRTEGCTTNAIDWAARNGQADVVEYLCKHRTEGFTQRAVVDANMMGHTTVYEILNAYPTLCRPHWPPYGTEQPGPPHFTSHFLH